MCLFVCLFVFVCVHVDICTSVLVQTHDLPLILRLFYIFFYFWMTENHIDHRNVASFDFEVSICPMNKNMCIYICTYLVRFKQDATHRLREFALIYKRRKYKENI